MNINELRIETLTDRPYAKTMNNDVLAFDFAPIPDHSYGAFRAHGLLLSLCTKGKAQFTVDTEPVDIEDGTVLLLNDGEIIDQMWFSYDFNCIGILLSEPYRQEMEKGIPWSTSLMIFARQHTSFRLLPTEVGSCNHYFQAISAKIQNSNHRFQRDLVGALITTFIIDLSEAIYRLQQVEAPKSTRSEELFNKFILLLDANFRTVRLVKWYADQLGVTQKYLSEVVKARSQRTPGKWIEAYTLREIRLLLKNSTLSIKQIAARLHFANQSFLGKYFRERVGMSPSEYRGK